MSDFRLVTSYKPTGDQPEAIEKLTRNLLAGQRHNVLLGVTGSGKTFTMAQVIARVNKPTLVIAPNKTLAAQLYSEFNQLFPENAVDYFVSYYDYYQPEAYIPSSDTYIQKDSSINDMIDSLNDDNGGSLNRGRNDADDDNSPNRVSLLTMLNNTLWGSWHDDFEEFWASLSGELSGATLGDASEIMYYNYMDVPAPISCVATKVVALESTSPDNILDGLRRFRDHGLKGFKGGQRLINVYYRNSPELAIALLKDSELRRDVIQLAAINELIAY